MTFPVFVGTVALAVLALQPARADLLNFDDVTNGTIINTHYSGVTFSCVGSGCGTADVYARSNIFAPSQPNTVSPMSTTESAALDLFDVRFGTVKAAFSTLQKTVSIDADATLPPEYLGTPTNKPFLQVFDSSNNLLGTILYAGDLVTGGFETLSFTSGSTNIAYVEFSSQSNSGPAVYGSFDNLSFSAGTTAPVPEPSSIVLLGSLVAGGLVACRKRLVFVGSRSNAR